MSSPNLPDAAQSGMGGGAEEDSDSVVALTAQLASRQAAQRPRHHLTHQVAENQKGDIDGINDGLVEQNEHNGGSSGVIHDSGMRSSSSKSNVQLSPTLRRIQLRTPNSKTKAPSHTDVDAPKIDEAAIYAVTAQNEQDEKDDDETQVASMSTAPSSKAASSQLQAIMPSPLSFSIAPTSADDAETPPIGKRMTVLLDEEMPSDENGEDNSEDFGLQHKHGERSHVTADAYDGVSQYPSMSGTNDGIASSAVPEERDADVGDGDAALDEPQVDAAADSKVASGMLDLAQSMATLRAAHQDRHDDAEIAHKEPERGTSADTDEADDNDEDEELEEEEEPSLKYSRLRGSVPDMLKRDSASALAVSDRFLALGTHGGSIYILDEQGNLIKGFRTHSASVLALVIDSTSEFVGSAGMDGLVSVAALSSSESYTFDFKRVMRSISVEPGFGRRSTRSFVCGGMAGQLVLREKSWFGHREVILHEGEGPIWTTQWRGNLIAWANDKGVRIYDTASKQRITFIAPPEDRPRADLFRCTLFWQDDSTLLIAWADTIKVAKIRTREQNGKGSGASGVISGGSARPAVEITAILQLDCMISGLAPRGTDFLILAYITEDDYDNIDDEDTSQATHKRREGQRPELRLISQDGEELSSDVLSLQSFARFQCNDYLLVPSADAMLNGAAAIAPKSKDGNGVTTATDVLDEQGDYFYVVSPKDIVIARSRDQRDHIDWLLQHRHYEEALSAVQGLSDSKAASMGFDANVIGARYLTYLINDKEDWIKASVVAPSILKDNVQAWEDVVFAFAEKKALPHLLPNVPVRNPTLSTVVYDMILAHLLRFDESALLETIKTWPVENYSVQAVVLALEDGLRHGAGSDSDEDEANGRLRSSETERKLMECLAEIFVKNRQPGKALPYYLRLRKPDVFDLIREHNLFTVVQDQALQLIEFEADLLRKAEVQGELDAERPWQSIELLVDHTHSIPVHRVVPQLQRHQSFLYRYLNALFDRDPQSVAAYSDTLVELYAEFAYDKLMSYLRTMSSHYSFEKAYNICKALDYVPEMVFLLSRIGDNKTALMLIIERLGDVERAITFVKEEKDPELWENLVQYSEDKPKFIRGLLENVGGEVDAVTLIRRIKNGLQIPGLRDALIKILGDFNLQISLLEGCAGILTHDAMSYARILYRGQQQGLYCDAEILCSTCGKRLLSRTIEGATRVDGDGESENKQDAGITTTTTTTESDPSTNAIFFLCQHAHHLTCLVNNPAAIPKSASLSDRNLSTASQEPATLITMTTTRALATGARHAAGAYGPMQREQQNRKQVQDKIRYQARLRAVLKSGCPVCRGDREQFRL